MKHGAAQYLLAALLAIISQLPLHAETTSTAYELESFTTHPIMARMRGRFAPVNPMRKAFIPRRNETADNTTGTASIVASNLPLARVVNQLQDESGIPIQLKSSIADTKVSIIETNKKPVELLLQNLASSNPGITVEKTADGFDLWDTKEYQKQAVVAVVYDLNSGVARNIAPLVTPLLSGEYSSANAYTPNNKLVVVDLPETQDKIARLISKLDQKLFTRVFYVRHRRTQELELILRRMLSLPENQVCSDEPTHQIILTATQSEIQRATLILEALDISAAEAPARQTTSTYSTK